MNRELGNGYELSDDRDRLDRAALQAYLTTSYWALGRTRERQDELIDQSDHVVGLFHEGRQVGFARAVDCAAARFVYLADVYVLEEHRGAGLGVELVREIVERSFGELRWMLHTADAQGLYERLGFSEGKSPYPLMERPARRGAPGGDRQ
jgi:GNAT superfamily N-acetyltransferase